jgi:separase
MSASLDGMLQSLRLWNRAVDALSRFAPSPTSLKLTRESNPFEMLGLKKTLPVVCPEAPRLEQPVPKKVFTCRPSMDGLEWQVSEGLLATLFTLSRAYFNRGSAREAEYFAKQVQDMAEALNAPAMMSRALARTEEILLHQGQLKEALCRLKSCCMICLARILLISTGCEGNTANELQSIRMLSSFMSK